MVTDVVKHPAEAAGHDFAGDGMQVALVLIDEVHLLNEERGSALEAGCVGRIKMVSGLREMKSVRHPLPKLPHLLPSMLRHFTTLKYKSTATAPAQHMIKTTSPLLHMAP